MTTDVQRDILEALAKGAVLKMRFNKRGQPGDFLLFRDGKQQMVVTRRTVAAICRMERSSTIIPEAGEASDDDATQPETESVESLLTEIRDLLRDRPNKSDGAAPAKRPTGRKKK